MAQQKVGIVVGRFQVPDLHDGHLALLRHAKANNDVLMIVVGDGVAKTSRNPLSYELRKQMLLEAFPEAIVVMKQNQRSNADWSEALDDLIKRTVPGAEYRFYGSRESFNESYSGTIPFEYVPEVPGVSGTSTREHVTRNGAVSAEVRAGIIKAFSEMRPASYQAVDIAVVDYHQKRVLLGRKPGEKAFRFPGGFVDPTDESLESAAKRELWEETGMIEVSSIWYLGSFRMKDWRYRGERDQIMTSFFIANYVYGGPVAGDDLVETKWFPFDQIIAAVVPEHQPLATRLITQLKKGG